MIKFDEDFFKKLDDQEEQKIVIANLDNEETYKRVASIYGTYVYKWSGKKLFFLPSKLGQKLREKRIIQIKKLIKIATELGVPLEIYIKAQFEEQMSFLKTKGLNYVPFANLISEKAVQRFERYKKRIDSSYNIEDERRKEFYSTQALDIEKAIKNSIANFYWRLKIVKKHSGEVTRGNAVRELDMMARAGQISNIYVYVSPLNKESEYLADIQTDVEKKLNDFEKKEAKRIRDEAVEALFSEKFRFAEGILGYV